MIRIVYATNCRIGGWASFTRHLADTLTRAGETVQIHRIAPRSEEKQRPFGDRGHTYQNLGIHDFSKVRNDPIILACFDTTYKEHAEAFIRMGAGTIIHDTDEHPARMNLWRPWIVRPILAALAREPTFIRHPYIRHKPIPEGKRAGAAVPTRVAYRKGIMTILEAQQLGAKIDLLGQRNTLYARTTIREVYPDWDYTQPEFARTGESTVETLARYKWAIDLTDTPNDGGGTQYTSLEAWDAGTPLIINKTWPRPGGDMEAGKNCFVVADAHELKRLITSRSIPNITAVIEGGRKQLAKHAPGVIGPKVMKWLNTR